MVYLNVNHSVLGIVFALNIFSAILEGVLSVFLYDIVVSKLWVKIVVPQFFAWMFCFWCLGFDTYKKAIALSLFLGLVIEGTLTASIAIYIIDKGYLDLFSICYITWGFLYFVEIIALAFNIGLSVTRTLIIGVISSLVIILAMSLYYGFQPLIFVLLLFIPAKPLWVVYRLLFDTAIGVLDPFKIVQNIYSILYRRTSHQGQNNLSV